MQWSDACLQRKGARNTREMEDSNTSRLPNLGEPKSIRPSMMMRTWFGYQMSYSDPKQPGEGIVDILALTAITLVAEGTASI